MFFGTIGVSEAACWDDDLAKKDRDLLLMRSDAVYQLLDGPQVGRVLVSACSDLPFATN